MSHQLRNLVGLAVAPAEVQLRVMDTVSMNDDELQIVSVSIGTPFAIVAKVDGIAVLSQT